ncbi:MAG: aldehyde dehydrogenase family protein [Acidimicrobiia bacterium]
MSFFRVYDTSSPSCSASETTGYTFPRKSAEPSRPAATTGTRPVAYRGGVDPPRFLRGRARLNMAVTSTPATAASELVARMRASFESGRTRPAAWRRDQLEQLRKLLIDREAELLDALHEDLGKPPIEGWAADVAFTRAELDFALKHLDGWMKPERIGIPLAQQPGSAHVRREPLGVVLIIGPWNYPVQLILTPLVGAIAAGNCVVLKPSELAPATSTTLARLVPQYLDPECVAVVEGAVPETQALLAERWDHILYTGNGTVGRVVMEAAAKHLTPVTLELGGKSPCIVDKSAKIDVAARRIAWGKFLNAGQTCVAPDYVLVDQSIEHRLVDAIRTALDRFYGEDPQSSTDYARIVNDRHFARLEALLAGGTAAIGGKTDAATRYIAPTVLTDVALDAAVMQEEIFGPILPIIPVADLDAAIDVVNGRDKPLALYVFAEDRAVQDRVVDSTSSGGMCVNGTVLHVGTLGLPFGGVGPSGMGAYHGRASFETFSHAKSILTKSTRVDPSIPYPPYTKNKERIIRRVL